MIVAFKRSVALAVAACVVASGLPRPARSSSPVVRGAGSAGKAAAWHSSGVAAGGASVRSVAAEAAAGEPVLALGALGAAYSDPDTTEFEFPDEDRKHLVRDVTAWVIAAAFAAYFIVKVFIEKDEDQSSDKKPPGKTIP